MDPTGVFIKAPYTALLALGVLAMTASSLRMLSPWPLRAGQRWSARRLHHVLGAA
eukprot:CAMPEP_0172170182 /NCGR_PEP_ID=MMETSP1050-20130122/11120_1 /TAXON_ID=233186 /ORGANISM="Cryptomonas curvata, Strain CCAP979/52" /LENGTH=54 /DNA_ID=CAMNT_0012841325 /DNA_START=323 /DNA_END=484 /DNA_ORIENTATION=-